ncbi:TPA: DUF2560 family protein [Klebsiella pneumoniae]|nr:DUF2560 family protein [Klebsiella pneumoniae]
MTGEMKQLTERSQITLSIMNLLGMNAELTKMAMTFIGDDILNYQLFVRCFNISAIVDIKSRVISAIEQANKGLESDDNN